MDRSRATIARGFGLIALTLAAVGAAQAGGAATTAADFGVTVTGPATAKLGEQVTYTIALTNSGPDAESAKLRFAGGTGATDTTTGEPLKTISQTPSQGTCKNDGTGVICRPDSIASGATVSIVVVAEVLSRDLPALDVQATVQPEKASAIDASHANDHAELVTAVPDPVKLKGVPQGCASRPFTLKVKTKVAAGAKTKLIVDRKALGSTTSSKLTVKVEPDELGPGNHDVTVVVQPAAGPPLAKEKAAFKTCA